MSRDQPTRRWRSLRWRLAALGFVASYVPALALLFVALATTTVDIREEAVGEGSDLRTINERDVGVDVHLIVPIAAVLLLPVAAGTSWVLAGRAVQPLLHIRKVADDIQAGELDRRIGLSSAPNEVAGLAASFDAMLDRLQVAAAEQQAFLQDASHEFRAPLAVLRTTAEVMSDDPDADPAALRDAIATMGAVAVQLSATAEALLVGARGGGWRLSFGRLHMARLAGEVVDAWMARAREAGIVLALHAAADPVVRADPRALRRLLDNLLDNAVRHTPAGGRVTVTVDSSRHAATLTVADNGPGVPAAAHARLFDRGWHGSESHGQGLGLALVRQIALGHGGEVRATAADPHGLVITVALPLDSLRESVAATV